MRDFFDNEDIANHALAIEQQLKDFGMHWHSEKKVVEGLPLAGQTWVLTGSLELMSRDVAKSKLEAPLPPVAPYPLPPIISLLWFLFLFQFSITVIKCTINPCPSPIPQNWRLCLLFLCHHICLPDSDCL